MPATYARQSIKWEKADLERLLDEGQATYFPGPGVYVVKLPEGGSVAVRPEQIIVEEPGAAQARWERVQEEAQARDEALAALAQAEMLGGSPFTVAELAAQPGAPRLQRRQARPPVTEHSHFSKEADDLIARFTKKG